MNAIVRSLTSSLLKEGKNIARRGCMGGNEIGLRPQHPNRSRPALGQVVDHLRTAHPRRLLSVRDRPRRGLCDRRVLPGVAVFGSEEPPPRLSDVARALRYPEVSIVIDLSAITHAEKLSYLDKLLPMLATLRRSIGLPHWIVVDEAHYFLHRLTLDNVWTSSWQPTLSITYRPSQLHPELLGAVESIIVTPLTDPWEVRALTTLCGAQVMEAEWGNVLGGLGIDEAAVLPQEAGARRVPQPFTITERITLHVRHRAKYFEVPMPEEQAFIFTCNGQLIGEQARTLREFVTIQDRLPVAAIEGHAQRADYSRWIAEVFGDHLLAAEIRKIEKQFHRDRVANFSESLIQLIYGRYELTG